MEVKKTGTGLKVLVGILIALLVLAIGYIVADKFIFNKNLESNTANVVNKDAVKTEETAKTNEETTKTTDKKEKNPATYEYIPVEEVENLPDARVNGFGKVTVKGYTKVEELKIENPDGIKGPVNAVFFYVLESNDEDFDKYLKGLDGNIYAKKNAFSLGCLENNKITYVNFSDKEDRLDLEITGATAEAILKSTIDNPVVLNLEKLAVTVGKDPGSLCYSHMTYIRLAE